MAPRHVRKRTLNGGSRMSAFDTGGPGSGVGSSQRYTKGQDAALLVLRVIVAAVFLYAGSAKWPFWSAAPEGMSSLLLNVMKFLSIVEPLGSVALVLGI